MERFVNQSNITTIALVFVGTTSMLLANPYDTDDLLPTKMYTYEYNQSQEQESYSYLLKHESMPDVSENINKEVIVEIPIIKSIKVKFNKPRSLDFICIENDEGFIE